MEPDFRCDASIHQSSLQHTSCRIVGPVFNVTVLQPPKCYACHPGRDDPLKGRVIRDPEEILSVRIQRLHKEMFHQVLRRELRSCQLDLP